MELIQTIAARAQVALLVAGSILAVFGAMVTVGAIILARRHSGGR